ncbi:MAG TPA: c-type cytochrome biogenesis protein CcsB [Streptosporangiaceae bacterium]|nr:c-type cytochrome biogenesis protein CcsB [Streptosporangiaceae bacterium]
MPVNIGLAQLSQHLLLFTIVVYALAMLAYACDFAFGRQRITAPPLGTAPELVGVGAAASAAGQAAGRSGQGPGGRLPDGPDAATPAAPSTGPSPARPGWWVRSALTLTIVGLLAHVSGILLRGISEDRVPWGNMYEFITAITCTAVIVLVVAVLRYKAYYIGLFVLIPVVFALGVAVAVIYTPAGSLVPALQSYWIAIHVTAMIIASGLFIVGAVTTAMYLAADRHERRVAAGQPSKAAGIMMRLPRPLILDRLSYRAILFAFPVWTFGIMAGAIWADHAWGRYWGWDPKETWSFITWVVYAGFLHSRATGGWRGRRAAYIQLAGFGCLMFNLIGINLWVTGLHSYAGMG